jgi:hypothetical protein
LLENPFLWGKLFPISRHYEHLFIFHPNVYIFHISWKEILTIISWQKNAIFKETLSACSALSNWITSPSLNVKESLTKMLTNNENDFQEKRVSNGTKSWVLHHETLDPIINHPFQK